MSKKISQLPPVAAVTGDDEQETNQGGVSRKFTQAQLLNYLQSLNPIVFAGLQVSGASSFSGGNVVFDSSGNVDFVNVFSINSLAQEIDLVAGATIFGPASVWTINAVGAAQFKGGVLGDANSFDLNGADGSANFANSQFNIATDGSFSAAGANFTVSGSGHVEMQSDLLVVGGGNFASNTIQFGADGSAIFANGGATVNAAGEIQAASYFCGGDAGATQDVTIGAVTLHFIGGLFTGTTP